MFRLLPHYSPSLFFHRIFLSFLFPNFCCLHVFVSARGSLLYTCPLCLLPLAAIFQNFPKLWALFLAFFLGVVKGWASVVGGCNRSVVPKLLRPRPLAVTSLPVLLAGSLACHGLSIPLVLILHGEEVAGHCGPLYVNKQLDCTLLYSCVGYLQPRHLSTPLVDRHTTRGSQTAGN